MYYSERRQQFLIDQGYAFHVINAATLVDEEPISQENELKELARVLLAEVLRTGTWKRFSQFQEEAARIEELDEQTLTNLFQTPTQPAATSRVVSSLENLTGGDELVYYEYSTANPT